MNKQGIIVLTIFFILMSAFGILSNTGQSAQALEQSNNEDEYEIQYAMPSSQTRDGITVNIKKYEANKEQTVVIISVSGLSSSDLASSEENGCTPYPHLKLSNGSLLAMTSGSTQGFESRFVFPPIPDGVEASALLLACIPNTRPGDAPENWVIPIKSTPTCIGAATPCPDF